MLKQSHELVADMLRKYFPNTIVLITFGNNDCKFHYDAPHLEEKKEFYNFLYDLWFNKHPANSKIVFDNHTFNDGGYYRFDFNDKITFLSFNSLPYNIK